MSSNAEIKAALPSPLSVCTVNHLHAVSTCFTRSYKDFILSNECLTLITLIAFYFDISYLYPSYVTDHFYASPPLFSPRYFLASCVSYVVVFTHARMHVCMCVHACLLAWWSRGWRPSPAQTNSPLSLKAVNSVQTGQRKQAGPAGKDEEGGNKNNVEIVEKQISYLPPYPVKVQCQVFTNNYFKISCDDSGDCFCQLLS